MPSEQEQHKSGQELRQPDVSQVQRAMGDLVDLPSHRHRLHFERDHEKEARERIRNKIGITERWPSREPRVLRGQHCRFEIIAGVDTGGGGSGSPAALNLTFLGLQVQIFRLDLDVLMA